MTASLDWSRIDTVLLDMDGTLLDLHYDNHFWREHVPLKYAELRGLAADEAREALAPRFAALRGRLEWYCVDYWSRELEMDVLALKHEAADRIAPLPGVVEFLAAAHALGKRLWLVTNAHPKVVVLKMQRTGLAGQFEHVVSSHTLGFAKEDDRFWPALAASLPFVPARALMVDDSLPVLRAAQRFGVAQVIHLLHPDSQSPPVAAEELPSVHRLVELTPRS
ncbi:MAG: GMP/IMP nucleotidase [Nevskiales bacterium]